MALNLDGYLLLVPYTCRYIRVKLWSVNIPLVFLLPGYYLHYRTFARHNLASKLGLIAY